MKRRMMLLIMIVLVLWLPMNVKATEEAVIEGDWIINDPLATLDLEEDTLVTGNLILEDMNSLDVFDCTLHIKGDFIINNLNFENKVYNSKVIVDGDVIFNSPGARMVVAENGSFEVGGKMTSSMEVSIAVGSAFHVKGDYLQENCKLEIYDKCDVSFGGDLCVRGEENGAQTASIDIFSDATVKGDVIVEEDANAIFWDDSVLTVDGNIMVDTPSDRGVIFTNIILKGDFIVKECVDRVIIIDSLCTVGEETQILDLPKAWRIENINFQNQNIELHNYLSGRMGSDFSGITLKDGVFRTVYFSADGYNVTIPGDVYAEGTVKLCNYNYDAYNPVYSEFVVEGDYIQMAEALYIYVGYEQMVIEGDLRLQSVDMEGNYSTGSGYLTCDKEILIGGDLVIDTTENMRGGVCGKIYVAGDVVQKSQSVFMADYIVLNGQKPQSVTLLKDTAAISTQSMIDTLELTQERKYYTFSPEPCWNKLIQLEGIRNEAGVFKYYEDGNWASDAHKYVEYDGATFLVANGVVATNINGIAQDPLNLQDWYFLSGGQVQEQHTGLAEYGGEWFYVENGKLDTTMSKCVEYDGETFMFAAGRLIGEVSGLVQDPSNGVWYYLAGGRVVAEFSGLAYYDGEWFYVSNGKLDNTFKGCTTVDGVVFRVENGVIIGEGHTSANGKCTHCGKITSAHGSLWSPY